MKKVWTKDIKCCVALTFDFDAETFWFSRTMDSLNSPNLLGEGRYGAEVGVARILKMLDRQNIKATFFIPGWVIERHTKICKEIINRGHEIGYHGYLHEKAYFSNQVFELINKNKKIMKDLLGVTVLGFRIPETDINNETVELFANMGFKYSSNMMDSDHPYFHITKSKNKIVELPTNWLYDDTSHFFFTLQNPERRPIAAPSKVYEIWKSEFDGIYEEEGIFTLMLHPQIIGRVSRITMLEKLIEHMKTKEGIFIGPAIDVCELVQDNIVIKEDNLDEL